MGRYWIEGGLSGEERREERKERGSWASTQLLFFLLSIIFFFQNLEEKKRKEKTKNKTRVLLFPKIILLFCKFKYQFNLPIQNIFFGF